MLSVIGEVAGYLGQFYLMEGPVKGGQESRTEYRVLVVVQCPLGDDMEDQYHCRKALGYIQDDLPIGP